VIGILEIGSLFRSALREWHKHNSSHRAAALAFYSLVSLAPVVMIAIAMAGLVFGNGEAQSALLERIRALAGEETVRAIRALIGNPGEARSRISATLIGIVTLLIGATAAFADLQESLNTIWKAAPTGGRSVLSAIKNHFLSFLMVLGVGLFLIASLGASAALAAMTRTLGYRPVLPPYLWPLYHGVSAFLAVTLLFALIYKLLPEVRIRWSDVWIGAGVTSLLFTAGKALIGWFLASSLMRPIYGRAGSIVAFLIWIYFSAQIFFLGAEFTHVYAETFGSRIIPSRGVSPRFNEVVSKSQA
jgi:membrane protein